MTAEDPKLQPFLQGETLVLRAPTQAWSDGAGRMGAAPIEGIYLSDTRIVSGLEVLFDGRAAEAIATVPRSADSVDFVGVLRHVPHPSPDPHLRVSHRRTATADGVEETLVLSSMLDRAISIDVVVIIAADLTPIDRVKLGLGGHAPSVSVENGVARWGGGTVSAELRSDARLGATDSRLSLDWTVSLPARGEASVGWMLEAADSQAVVAASPRAASWTAPPASGNDRLDRWTTRALVDLDALRMTTVADPSADFLAAGAPWFLTLFGRDAIWSARFLVPLGGTIASDTLRVLAGMQGTVDDPATAEQPGKIMHELRSGPMSLPDEGIILPPLYYGTVDATALWVCLLCDAADAGMEGGELEAFLPHLTAALEWMRDYGDADGDGLLEYIDVGGHGLANQGWKDSGDSVQWKDGRLAQAPIALCEVQAYAYEAATRGAALLERFGHEAESWREWAEHLRERFHEQFWIDDPLGNYPAIALDANKRAVDSLTSNIGHLLGTGLLDQEQSALVAARLVSPELNSGYGLRTMATTSAGYWPLSYHGGSVWAHDTAVAIRGLSTAGFPEAASKLADGLLAAAACFDYRIPELHSGDAASAFERAVPYPAACRPQAWSAAAAIAVHGVLSVR